MIYSVVLLDGKELHCLSLEELKSLFFKRQINQDSLCCSAENPQWMMLKRVFDINEWIREQAELQNNQTAQQSFQNNYQPAVNPFHQSSAQYQNETTAEVFDEPSNSRSDQQFVTFNQFPPNEPSQNNYSYAQNATNGNSQNNQSETYYQAETTQTDYNFKNNQTNFAPSKYSSQPNSVKYQSSNPYDFVERKGLKQASIFLFINALFYILTLVLGSSFSTPAEESQAYKTGYMVGAVTPLLIDLILGVRLWKMDDAESARKWVLARSYFGFVIFGIVIPIFSVAGGNIFVGVFSLITTVFYFLSLTIALHGKESPANVRLVLSGVSFGIYSLIVFGTVALAAIGMALPKIGKLNDLKNAQINKYKIEGAEFQDKTTGAKVVLPAGWSMIKLDNPFINSAEARMIAVDEAGNRMTMLEVVPVPGNLDMKRQNTAYILDEIANNVVKALKKQLEKKSGFGENSFKEVTRLGIFVGTHQAKLIIVEKTENGLKSKGHMIITNDELTFYVLHSWCPSEEYETAQEDFKFFEKNFTVPEKINSTFTQTAENQKK